MILELYSDTCEKTEHEGAEIQQGLLDVEDFQLIFVLKVVTNIFRYP